MIDYWCNAFTPDREPLWSQVIADGGLEIRTRGGEATDGFAEPEEMLARMDHLGVRALILPVQEVDEDAPLDDFGHYAVHAHEMAELAAAQPRRFFGVYSVDPDAGTADVDRCGNALEEAWCVGLHTHTHSWDRAFDHPDYLPYYELCDSAEVPFVMQAGASGGDFRHEAGHPTAIGTPARRFPAVQFVLSHTGAPWVEQTIAMASQFENVVVGTATHPPRRWPPELIRFLNGAGREKLLFGTGFPLTGHARSLAQLHAMELDACTLRCLLAANAARIFTRIPEPPGA